MKSQTAEKSISLAKHLASAWDEGVGVEPVTELAPNLTVDEAYQVQLVTIKQEVASGKSITGKKIGLTSKAMQDSLGVGEPDYGHLLDSMVVKNRGTVKSSQVLQAKVEGEIAFVLKKDLVGPNVTSFEVMQATDYIVPALEIVDSRIKDWKITLADTVADNASSGLYVLGDKKFNVTDVDLKQIGMALYKNNTLINTGVGAAALGDPAKCVAWLANKLHAYGIQLKAGEVILAGALSAAAPAVAGDTFQAKFAHLGEVTVFFEE